MKNKYCAICNTLIWERSTYCKKHSTRNRRSYKGKNNPNYKNGNSLIKHYCLGCGKKISKNAKRCNSCAQLKLNPKGRNYSICIDCGIITKSYRPKRCDKCNAIYLGKKLRGKNHPCYIDGTGNDPYPLEFNYIKKDILIRDNYICQVCGKKGNHVHHIDYNKNNCKKNNLITTCNQCNIKANYNRDYWFAYFRYIMEEK